MLNLNSATLYFWYNSPVDMRKGFDALCRIVHEHINANVLQGGVYIFVNRKRNQIKLLHFEGDGLAIYYKRLEKECMNFHPLQRVVPVPLLICCNYN